MHPRLSTGIAFWILTDALLTQSVLDQMMHVNPLHTSIFFIVTCMNITPCDLRFYLMKW